MGNTIREKQVLISPESNSVGTELPETFFGETKESKETNWAKAMEEIGNTQYHWIMKVQSNLSPNLQAQDWELVKDDTNILKFSERISDYNPLYIQEGRTCWVRALSLTSMR